MPFSAVEERVLVVYLYVIVLVHCLLTCFCGQMFGCIYIELNSSILILFHFIWETLGCAVDYATWFEFLNYFVNLFRMANVNFN